MVPWASKAIVEFHPTLVEIAKMKAEHLKEAAERLKALSEEYAEDAAKMKAAADGKAVPIGELLPMPDTLPKFSFGRVPIQWVDEPIIREAPHGTC